MDVVARSRFSAAFTFLYSQRPGTPAATMPGQVPRAVMSERYERLIELVNDIAWEENRRFDGQDVEVMFALGEGRKDDQTHRLSGRARDNRLVHVAAPQDPDQRPRPGDIATVRVTHAAPHHLTSDAPLRNLRRTRGGDAWEQRENPPAPAGVGLGMPALGKPVTA